MITVDITELHFTLEYIILQISTKLDILNYHTHTLEYSYDEKTSREYINIIFEDKHEEMIFFLRGHCKEIILDNR